MPENKVEIIKTSGLEKAISTKSINQDWTYMSGRWKASP